MPLPSFTSTSTFTIPPPPEAVPPPIRLGKLSLPKQNKAGSSLLSLRYNSPLTRPFKSQSSEPSLVAIGGAAATVFPSLSTVVSDPYHIRFVNFFILIANQDVIG